MRKFLIVFPVLLQIGVSAQTKKIAFKSHSGNMDHYMSALEKNLFDMDNSNFGQAPQRRIKSAQLDSVIYVSDSIAILVTSEYSTSWDKPHDEPTIWRAGRELVYRHPLFSQKHSLDSIKKVLEIQYYFRNSIKKVKFIGYDNKRVKPPKSKQTPAPIPVIDTIFKLDSTELITKAGTAGTSLNKQSVWMLGILVLIALSAGLVAWKFMPLLRQEKI